jgi:tetratricopeptide (TPR) repeat protein
MSRTLTLIHAGWTSVKALARGGRRAEARTQLERLLTHPDLPAPVAADARRLAGELELERERFAAARRYFRAAAELEPEHARTQYLIGVAQERDPHGDDRRAAARFRKAVALDAENPLYRAAFGRAAVRCGKVKAGVRALLAAAELAEAPDAAAVVRIIVDGLTEAGRLGAARRVLAKARFVCPGNRDLNTLWERVRFETARRRQDQRRRQDAARATEGDLVLLPFVRLVVPAAGKTPAAGAIRRDLVSKPRPHLPRLRSIRADR